MINGKCHSCETAVVGHSWYCEACEARVLRNANLATSLLTMVAVVIRPTKDSYVHLYTTPAECLDVATKIVWEMEPFSVSLFPTGAPNWHSFDMKAIVKRAKRAMKRVKATKVTGEVGK